MYPRAKVKETENQVSQAAATYLLKVSGSFSLDGDEPTKSTQADQDIREEVIACPNFKDVTPITVPKGKLLLQKEFMNLSATITNSSDEDKRNNIRASSIPPPRAVLSSPENDSIVGNRNKRIQERSMTVKGQAPDSFGMSNQHRSVTRRSCRQAQPTATEAKAKRLPFNSNIQSQVRTHNGGVNIEKESLEEHSSYGSAAVKAGACKVYPKIRCSGAGRRNSKEKVS